MQVTIWLAGIRPAIGGGRGGETRCYIDFKSNRSLKSLSESQEPCHSGDHQTNSLGSASLKGTQVLRNTDRLIKIHNSGLHSKAATLCIFKLLCKVASGHFYDFVIHTVRRKGKKVPIFRDLSQALLPSPPPSTASNSQQVHSAPRKGKNLELEPPDTHLSQEQTADSEAGTDRQAPGFQSPAHHLAKAHTERTIPATQHPLSCLQISPKGWRRWLPGQSD